ncbi:MAG: hypothetical protein IJM05_07760 [Bacteroidales bacterium]|nr:hypothetical protein [Bacteroidales bacterium]
MTDKEKYMNLMQRYWDAETTPVEERELARYVARVDDPEFEQLRGVLGYLSIGKEKEGRKAKTDHLFPLVAIAASIAAVAAIGLSLRNSGGKSGDEFYVCYAYGEKTTDNQQVMASVESSLADFFGGSSPVETNLFEMFER